LAVKKFGEKAALQGLVKELWRMFTCIANHQSKINSKTKPNKAIPYSFAHMARPLFWCMQDVIAYKRPHQVITPCT